jgi:hypothetical protein
MLPGLPGGLGLWVIGAFLSGFSGVGMGTDPSVVAFCEGALARFVSLVFGRAVGTQLRARCFQK